MTIRSVPCIGIVFATLLLMFGCASSPESEGVAQPAVSQDEMQATQAIAEAKAALKEVDALGFAWRDTAKVIKNAESAAGKGEYQDALKQANKAKMQAIVAKDQYYLQQAKFKLDKLRKVNGLSREQQAQLVEGEAAFKRSQGAVAYEILSKLEAEVRGSSPRY